MSDWTGLLQATVGIDHITPDSAREPLRTIGQEGAKIKDKTTLQKGRTPGELSLDSCSGMSDPDACARFRGAKALSATHQQPP